MSSNTKQLVVFTDLDGTLLDHDTYSFDAASESVSRLKLNNIPVIITTSKTWEEVSDLQDELGLSDPCIIENGSAVYLGESSFSKSLSEEPKHVLGKNYAEICTFINQLSEELRKFVYGFNDMSAEDVAMLTGLPIEKAKKAKARSASEPFLWSGDDKTLLALKKEAANAGLRLVKGGRFYHLLSDVDKSSAVKWLMYQAQFKFPGLDFQSCALGDGPNDADMLKTVDTGIVIANPHSETPDTSGAKGNIIYSKSIGPQGWAEEVDKLLNLFGYK